MTTLLDLTSEFSGESRHIPHIEKFCQKLLCRLIFSVNFVCFSESEDTLSSHKCIQKQQFHIHYNKCTYHLFQAITSNCCSKDFPFLLISLIRVNTAILISCSTFLCVSFSSFNLDKKRDNKTFRDTSHQYTC